MAFVVVGGQARRVGKTSVVAGLISAINERRWTAIKTSGHIHQDSPGAASNLIAVGRGFVLTEEPVARLRAGDGRRTAPQLTDTARFAAAGAERVFWLQAEAGCLVEAVPHLRKIIADAVDVMVESNGILQWLAPDLYLLVLDYGVEEFKPSAQRFLSQAAAFLVHRDREEPLWQSISPQTLPARPMLFMRPPQYVTPEIVEFVRRRLARESGV
jgi:molybdopterin-guanine dinucleotide biosynthesis protein